MSSKLKLTRSKADDTMYIARPIYQQDDVMELSGYERAKDTALQKISKNAKKIDIVDILLNLIPVLRWLPKYNCRKSIMNDLTSGITVAVMHIPQGMAYGLLAGVPPSVGLYMAFFPTLAYFIFGTSRHISMGTFAVVSIMVSKIVLTHATVYEGSDKIDLLKQSNDTLSASELETPIYSPLEVVTALTFLVGIYHIIMGALKLGTLSSLLSEPLVNGFTTAAAIHVITSQTKDLFGIAIPRHSGAFKIIFTIRDLFKQFSDANLTAVYISLLVIVFMIIMNEFAKPWIMKKFNFPLPSELIAVVGGTLVSYYLNLGSDFDIILVGDIPTGLPMPKVPPMALLQELAVEAIAVTIVSYSIVMSMALTFGRKLQYEILPNQELFAMGMSNIVGSFFCCIPICCSLSRSLIQEQTGGKTQVASVVSSGLILVVLLWIGPFFEPLPRCVLAGVIVVALKGMLLQFGDLKRFMKEGFFELLVWLTTFLTVVIIDIEIGLLAGVVVSLLALYIKGWKTDHYILGVIPDTGIYVDLKTHKRAVEIPKTKIFRYAGSINFAYKSYFKTALFKEINVNEKLLRKASLVGGQATGLESIRALIIDLSAVAHLDISACKIFTEIQKELQILDILFLLANPSDCVYDTLMHAHTLSEGPFQIFPTVHDAVCYAQKMIDIV